MNTPYVKAFNELGECANPITQSAPYLSVFKNRSQRREVEPPFVNNRAHIQLVVLPNCKYEKQVQTVWCKKTNKPKKILHYTLRNKA